jgi:hypothetical protein
MATSIKIKVDKSGLTAKTKAIRDEAVSREVLTEIGESLVRLNRKNARTGKAGDGSSFPPLSEKWKIERDKLSKVNDTHLAFGRGRSNATFTGQLIDAIDYEIDETQKSVTVDFNPTTRNQYTGLEGKKIGKPGQTNSEVAESFLSRGVKILGMSQEMRDRVNFILTAAIRKLLNSTK